MFASLAPCARWGWGAACLAWMLGTGLGCAAVDNTPSTDRAGPVDDVTGNPGGGGDREDANIIVEPGETADPTAGPFANAATVVFQESQARIEGDLSSPSDVDVYDLGPVLAGDVVVVDVQAGSDLDAVAALFDADQNLIYANDDRAYFAGLLDPRISAVVRRDSERAYLAVASSAGSGTRGAYAVSVFRGPPQQVPPPQTQVIFMNFDGEPSVTIGSRPAVTIPPFEGSRIAPEFDGHTDWMIERIMEYVREDYAGLGVAFVSSREGPRPDGPHTTVYFGAYDPDLLGVADNVDEYNEQTEQQAVVFVDTFQAFRVLGPTADEMAQALANVASHETGHLLGLQHTHDPLSIMDVSATLRQMLGPQAFRRAPLDRYVFPVGYQDAPLSLVESVGGDLAALRAAARQEVRLRSSWYDREVGPAARDDLRFAVCFCGACEKARVAGRQSKEAPFKGPSDSDLE